MSWPRSSFAAHKLTEVEDSDTTLLHHLTRLQQAYQSRLPPTLAEDENLGFDLNAGRAGAQARLALLFDPKDRKQRLGPETAQAVFRALTGPNAQGACWKGWRQSGFGETQVSGPRAAVVHAEAIVACFERLWGQPAVCEGVPTTILRPPRSAALGAHVDSASLLELYVECRSLALAATRAAGATESLERQWAALHGCQALVHWAGPHCAAAKADGSTCGLARLSVPRFFALLSLLHPDHPHDAAPFAPPKASDRRAAAPDNSDPHGLCVPAADEERAALLPRAAAEPSVSRFLARGGPVFAPFFSKAALLALNEVLAALELPAANAAPTRPGAATAAWLQRLESRGKLAELRLVLRAALPPDGPVVPAPMVPAAAAGDARGESCAGGWQYPLCVTWLRGFPHMAREGGLRLTFVPCLLPRPPATAAGLERMETIEAERCMRHPPSLCPPSLRSLPRLPRLLRLASLASLTAPHLAAPHCSASPRPPRAAQAAHPPAGAAHAAGRVRRHPSRLAAEPTNRWWGGALASRAGLLTRVHRASHC